MGGIGEFIAFVREELVRGGNVGDGTEAKFVVVELLADEVRAVSGGVRAVGGSGCMGGEGSRVLEEEEWVGVVAKCARYRGGGSFGGVYAVAAAVMDGGAEVGGSVPVMGPRRSGVWA